MQAMSQEIWWLLSSSARKGIIQVLPYAFFWKFDTHPPPCNANTVEPYIFVMFYSGKSDTLPPPPTSLCNTWMAHRPLHIHWHVFSLNNRSFFNGNSGCKICSFQFVSYPSWLFDKINGFFSLNFFRHLLLYAWSRVSRDPIYSSIRKNLKKTCYK